MCRFSYIYALLLWVLQVSAIDYDYYWKDYHGEIPADALVGGKDANGHETYIGQAYLHNHGLYVIQIFPGATEFSIPAYGVKKTNSIIKILCTHHPEDFFWLRTTAKTFHVDTINLHPVIGGYDQVNNKGLLNIGRVMYQGILKNGNVAAYDLENSYLYVPHQDQEHRASEYEVLIYRDSLINKIDVRNKDE